MSLARDCLKPNFPSESSFCTPWNRQSPGRRRANRERKSKSEQQEYSGFTGILPSFIFSLGETTHWAASIGIESTSRVRNLPTDYLFSSKLSSYAPPLPLKIAGYSRASATGEPNKATNLVCQGIKTVFIGGWRMQLHVPMCMDRVVPAGTTAKTIRSRIS